MATSSTIRKVDSKGIITTVTGNGTYGFSGDGGPASQAVITVPGGLAVDTQGALYFGDVFNYRVRKIVAPKATTSTLLQPSSNPSPVGQEIFLTAGVTSTSGTGVPTGTVVFKVDGGSGITETLDSTAHAYTASSLAQGKHTITASYSGDTNYSPSTSATLTEVIYGSPAVVYAVVGSGQTAVDGTPFPLPLQVLVEDAKGDYVPGVTVTFSGTGLKFSSATAVTGANGRASVTATPTAVGSLTASAAVSGVSKPATFARVDGNEVRAGSREQGIGRISRLCCARQGERQNAGPSTRCARSG